MASHLEDLLQNLERQQNAHALNLGGLPRQSNNATSFALINHQLPSPNEEKRTSVRSLRKEDTSLSPSVYTKSSFNWSDSNRQLIVSILTCLNRVFQQEDCGKALHSVLNSAGFTILPLLDIENELEIQELTMDCLKSILRIDCDILRRPLMELSSMGTPSCTMKDAKDGAGRETMPASVVSNSVENASKNIVSRCNELLTFMDSLPEQVIY